MANKTITQLDAAQSLNDNMVIAVQDTNTTYKTTLADIKAYCGGGSGGDKYKVGDRVNDDSNNPVGTVSSIFTDGNGDRYAVVCLDAVNRLNGTTWANKQPTMTAYTDFSDALSAKETATSNTTDILASGTAASCNHCRSKSFIIGGVTYNGQLPNLKELAAIFSNKNLINNQDSTASSYPSLIIPTSSATVLSSNYYGGIYAWCMGPSGSNYLTINTTSIGNSANVIPVLEIPLED